MHWPSPRLAESHAYDGQGPSRVDDVVNKQHGRLQNATNHLEGTIDVAELLGRVLHLLDRRPPAAVVVGAEGLSGMEALRLRDLARGHARSSGPQLARLEIDALTANEGARLRHQGRVQWHAERPATTGVAPPAFDRI